MPGPLIAAAGIGAASGLIQGWMGNRSNRRQIRNARDDRKWNAEQAALARSEQDRYTRELMADQFGIMADSAKRAGINKYAVIGGVPTPSAPAVIPGQSNLGSIKKDDNAFGMAIRGGMAAMQGAMMKAQIDNLNADTQVKLSDAARASQPGSPPGTGVIASPVWMEDLGPGQELKPGEVDAHAKGDRTKNLNEKAAWGKIYMIPDQPNTPLYMLGDDVGEVFDSIPMMLMVYNHPHNKPIINAWIKKHIGNEINKFSIEKFFRQLDPRVPRAQATPRSNRSSVPHHSR